MSTKVTIFIKEPDAGRALSIVKRRFPNAEVQGPTEDWNSIVIKNLNSRLTLNCMIQRNPGDAVSKILLGAGNFFRRVKTEAVANQAYLKSFIFSSKMLIGIVADPELSEEDAHFDLIFEIADLCGGIIFNGNGMVNATGDLILDDQGAFDVRVK